MFLNYSLFFLQSHLVSNSFFFPCWKLLVLFFHYIQLSIRHLSVFDIERDRESCFNTPKSRRKKLSIDLFNISLLLISLKWSKFYSVDFIFFKLRKGRSMFLPFTTNN